MDGRTARALRTKEAIADALHELLSEGHLRPTFDEIAERAGVAPRTIFVHFPDREQLLVAVGERQAALIVDMYRFVPADGPLHERLDAFVEQRARVLEAITPVRRAALLQEHTSQHTRDGLARFRALKRSEVVRIFAGEIEARPVEERPLLTAAVGAAAAWTAWEALRAHQGLSVEEAAGVMRATLEALLTRT